MDIGTLDKYEIAKSFDKIKKAQTWKWYQRFS